MEDELLSNEVVSPSRQFYGTTEKSDDFPSAMLPELKSGFFARDTLTEMLYVGVPASITIGFTFCTSIIPLAMVGKLLGEKDLSGASVGYFLICIFIQYPMIGLTYAIDTLCSHEYGRRGCTPRLGLILQRGLLINFICLAPLCASVYFLRPALNMLYGEEEAGVAEDFLHYSPLYLYALITLISLSKFLNNQQKAYIPTIALTGGVVVTPFVQYYLTLRGIRYTMLGMAITTWFQVFIMLAILLSNQSTRASLAIGRWSLKNMLDVHDVSVYIKFGVPSAIFATAEASALDLSILMAASYGVAEGSAFSAIMNILFLFAAITGGISTSACANIGRSIGANDPASVKRYVTFSIVATSIVSVMDSAFLAIFFDFFMSLFGTYGSTLELARSALIVILFLHIGDAIQYVFQGIFSGLGRNNLGAKILLCSVWGVGIPLCYLLGSVYELKMLGVAIGITVGALIETLVMIYFCLFIIDYEELCEEHRKHSEAAENAKKKTKRVESGFFHV